MIKRIAKAAKAKGLTFSVVRNGANHDMYSLDGLMIPIPRHTEMGNVTAQMIWKECEPKLGEGWWR